LDCLASDRLGVIRHEAFHQQRRPIARSGRPPGWISTFAFLKRHGLSLSVCAGKNARRGRSLRLRSKKPGAVSRPGGWRSFGEYLLLEDSRYTSQEVFLGD
jgi:hypothetical protein